MAFAVVPTVPGFQAMRTGRAGRFSRAGGLSFAVAALLFANSGNACPTKLPEGLTGTMVGQNLVVNGMAMAITQVESRDAAADVLNRVAKAWTDEGFKVKRNSASGWDIVSALSEQCMVTLQLTSRNGSFGYFSRSLSGSGTAAASKALDGLIPNDATVTSTVQSDDDGRMGVTVSMTTPKSPDETLTTLMAQLKDAGWGAIRARVMKSGPPRQTTASIQISAQRDHEQLDTMVWPERETQIVMTISTVL